MSGISQTYHQPGSACTGDEQSMIVSLAAQAIEFKILQSGLFKEIHFTNLCLVKSDQILYHPCHTAIEMNSP